MRPGLKQITAAIVALTIAAAPVAGAAPASTSSAVVIPAAHGYGGCGYRHGDHGPGYGFGYYRHWWPWRW
ncbi:MAG: hypothetical protein ACXWZX_18505 [Mycobacterium sp.]